MYAGQHPRRGQSQRCDILYCCAHSPIGSLVSQPRSEILLSCFACLLAGLFLPPLAIFHLPDPVISASSVGHIDRTYIYTGRCECIPVHVPSLTIGRSQTVPIIHSNPGLARPS